MNGTFTRRIDDLGRIVIPKELRRTLRIKEGDELEILPDGDKLVLKRYSPFQDMQYASDGVAQMIRQHVGGDVFILAGDAFVSAVVKGKLTSHLTPSKELLRASSTRSAIVVSGAECPLFEGKDGDGFLALEPILVNGDLIGTVVVSKQNQFDENALGYIRFASAILGAVVGM